MRWTRDWLEAAAGWAAAGLLTAAAFGAGTWWAAIRTPPPPRPPITEAEAETIRAGLLSLRADLDGLRRAATTPPASRPMADLIPAVDPPLPLPVRR